MTRIYLLTIRAISMIPEECTAQVKVGVVCSQIAHPSMSSSQCCVSRYLLMTLSSWIPVSASIRFPSCSLNARKIARRQRSRAVFLPCSAASRSTYGKAIERPRKLNQKEKTGRYTLNLAWVTRSVHRKSAPR